MNFLFQNTPLREKEAKGVPHNKEGIRIATKGNAYRYSRDLR
jgi:hypothetical protein